ncbi:MATE family efflux transporter [Paenibacillus sp. CCS19]|uniref:MATE family efflux transporter n=1 Tax=Paenibacillus sp. CCS19 TaxID=3158387 RepID=UPI0025690069|nr:MATE family efflux transporter [Paenibacillus cellulosilyticus]GMK40363.1 MATE family efflux transporter [Paenibacillus cellulosilyticus]
MSSAQTAGKVKDRSRENNLFLLTWPIFLEIFLFMLMGVADTFMLSALSDRAVSGVGASNQYLTIALLILEVIGNGASIVVAQYLGARNYDGASRISAVSITLNLSVGLVISGFFLIFSGAMMRGMNLHGETLTFATDYLGIVGGFIFLQAIVNSIAAIVRVHGFTKEAMFVSLGMNVVHIIGNYMLIFGKMGAPELGVQGAAISSVISRGLAVIVLFWLLYRVMRSRIQFRYYWNLSKEYIGKILRIGIPSALEQVMYHACQLVFLFYATYLGDQALSARQYAQNISMFIFLFAFAVGIGTSILVGRLVGANKKDQAYTRVWLSVRSASIVSLCVIALVMIFRHPLISMFTTDNEIIRIGAHILLYSIVLETGRTINIILVNSLRAAGDAKYPLWIGMVTMVGISVPLGYLFVFKLDMGLPGIWLAIASDEWLRAIIMSFRWKSRRWEKYALVKHSPDSKTGGAAKGASVEVTV